VSQLPPEFILRSFAAGRWVDESSIAGVQRNETPPLRNKRIYLSSEFRNEAQAEPPKDANIRVYMAMVDEVFDGFVMFFPFLFFVYFHFSFTIPVFGSINLYMHVFRYCAHMAVQKFSARILPRCCAPT
jgi:hypothetical protein